MTTTVWKGTRSELELLVKAINLNCECRPGFMPERCNLHKMLTDDQLSLDRLLFVRRKRQYFIDQEFKQ